MRQITHIVLHHSASPLTTTAETIREWHMGKGWSDVGYHFIIEKFGKVVAGRSLDIPGAHVKGSNETTIGVCLVGDNTTMERRWTGEQVESLRSVLDLLAISFPTATILGHREMVGAKTLCPGLDVRELLGLPSIT